MPTFLEILNDAIAIVTQAYPGSRIYEADGTSSTGTCSKESDIDVWSFLFLGPIQGTTVALEYHAPIFGSPVLKRGRCRGNGVVAIGLEQAITLRNDAGETAPFQRINLHWPSSPENDEPFYIFGGIEIPFVLVGTETGAVRTLDAGSLVRCPTDVVVLKRARGCDSIRGRQSLKG